jgi:multidrug efflux pump subunit AcrA (membrane-fusion protein)
VIEFENPADRPLRPEMTTTVNIVLEGRAGALSVPNRALRRDAGGTHVMVPTRDGVQRRTVTVGFRGAEHSEVLSGLRDGEHVVLGPARPCTDASSTEKES